MRLLERFRPAWLSISTALLLAMTLASPPTAAAATKITFSYVRIGDGCFGGAAPGDSALHFVWKSANGTPKANEYVATSPYGDWRYCSDDADVLIAGDVLKATVGATIRKFVMPLVTLNIARVDDVFRGRAPAGTTVVISYTLRDCCWDHDERVEVIADADGKWVYDGESELQGFDASIEWTSPKGDVVVDYDRAAEASVTIGRSVVDGYGDAGIQWKLALWDPIAGVRRGVARGTVEESGYYSGVFLDAAGKPVNVNVGDRVSGRSLAPDMSFVVRDIAARADVATDIVTGKCGNRYHAVVAVYRAGHLIGMTWGAAIDGQGNFAVDFGGEGTIGYDPANISHGDRLLVTCETRQGDEVSKSILVP